MEVGVMGWRSRRGGGFGGFRRLNALSLASCCRQPRRITLVHRKRSSSQAAERSFSAAEQHRCREEEVTLG
jgi:hypothetical protein